MPSLSAPSETEPAVQPAFRSAHRQPEETLSQRVHLPGRQGGTRGHSMQGGSLGSLQTLLSFRLPTLWLAGVRPGNQVGKESPLLRRRAQRARPTHFVKKETEVQKRDISHPSLTGGLRLRIRPRAGGPFPLPALVKHMKAESR